MATYWGNSCSFGLRNVFMVYNKYLIVSFFFFRLLGFWSGNLFLIAPFLIVAYLYDTRYSTKILKIEKGQNRFLSARPLPDRIFYKFKSEKKKKKKKKKKKGEERSKRTDHLIAFLFTFILIIQYMYVLGGPVAKSADILLPHFIIRSSHRYA